VKQFANKKRQTISKSASSSNPDRLKDGGKGGHNARTQSTIKRLNMYKDFNTWLPRNRKGQVVKAAAYQSELSSGTRARVEPNRRWFGNTRVISQSSLQKFQTEIGKVIKDPYQVILKPSKLPMSLLHDRAKTARVHILETQSFESTFGKKATRKRPNISVSDVIEMNKQIEESNDSYDPEKDNDLVREWDGTHDITMAHYFNAGQSRRIWNELYKGYVDSYQECRFKMVGQFNRLECGEYPKCDHIKIPLVRAKVITKAWVARLSKERPTLAFHASLTNPFGKGALINLLRQFGKLHTDKKAISCGFIGYPNVGKSSIINTLRRKKVCKVAPLAGETKVWQYITLMKRIFLVDCPGIVHPCGETETEIILKGVVSLEYVTDADQHIGEILRRVKREYMAKQYLITQWEDAEDFLEQMARRTGKLLKKGVPDVKSVAKMILNDWQRGKIPYFVRPPGATNLNNKGVKSVLSNNVPQGNSPAEPTPVEETPPPPEDPNKPPTAAELEKQLEPIRQDLRGLKVGLEFTHDDDPRLKNLPEQNDPQTEEDASEDVPNDPKDPDVEDVVEDEKNNDEQDIARLKKRKEMEDKIKKMKRYSTKNMKRRIDTLMKTSSLREGEAGELEDVKPSIRRKRKDKKDGDERPKEKLNSKQRRRKQREENVKKIGTHYYETANIKNRNRNRK
uniref:Nucleolar GTP-binding protein 2 n=1 Tax=Ciona savignyi TaxID=51511 RepID=H2YBI1_CIOSA